MDYIIIGGRKLSGEIAVYGAKNCALALIGASVLTDDEIVLNNCPEIVDIDNMLKLLVSMGKNVHRNKNTVRIWGGLSTTVADSRFATLLRGSALVLGSTVARYGKISLPLPGGCAIGARPMDIHLDGLRKFGVEVNCGESVVECEGKPIGNYYRLRFASVGATENFLCCCALAKGESVLENCATEPEVEALAQMLVKMGAQIKGIGTSRLVIKGVEKLHGTEFDIIPDRIVAATYLSAVIAAGGNVAVTNCKPEHLRAFLNLLKDRFQITEYQNAVKISAVSQPRSYGNIVTMPYPYFPTDMQSLVMSLASFSDGGNTVITENLFENRLQRHAAELGKMGAEINVKENTAYIRGVVKLRGANVVASDLRGGAGLIVAALNAEGQSIVAGIEHVNRGYVDLAGNLSSIGASITVNAQLT